MQTANAIASLPNLGPKSQQMLARAGIHTLADLRALGAVAAYVQTKRTGARASLNLLWALEGAISGLPWQDVARDHRTSLLLALEDCERRAGQLKASKAGGLRAGPSRGRALGLHCTQSPQGRPDMKPDKPLPPPATGKPSPAKPYDSLLDPLPLPDVSESDTDTAWGLWEASVEGAEKKPGAEAHPDFEPTVPVDLHKLFPKT